MHLKSLAGGVNIHHNQKRYSITAGEKTREIKIFEFTKPVAVLPVLALYVNNFYQFGSSIVLFRSLIPILKSIKFVIRSKNGIFLCVK